MGSAGTSENEARHGSPNKPAYGVTVRLSNLAVVKAELLRLVTARPMSTFVFIDMLAEVTVDQLAPEEDRYAVNVVPLRTRRSQ